MSTLVARLLLPHYEDTDKYDETSCNLTHWPDMWDGERQAERGIWEERKRMNGIIYFMARSRESRTIQHFRNLREPKEYMQRITARALADVVAECGWRVKNELPQQRYGVSPIYATRFDPDIDEDQEPQAPKPKPRQAKWSEWEEWEVKLLEEMFTPEERVHLDKRQKWPDRSELQAYVLVELAAANGWRLNDPYPRTTEQIYKIV